MTEVFAKVLVKMLTHPKVMPLSNAALGVWMRGTLYAKAQGTEGYVPPEALLTFARLHDADDDEVIDLIHAGLWEEEGDGWRIHDWGDVQTEPVDYAEMGRHSASRRQGTTDYAALARRRWTPKSEPDANAVRSDHANVCEEIEIEIETLTGTSVPAKVARRDELFEAVCEGCGVNWRELTPAGRGAANKAKGDLAAVGATPEEVRRRAASWADYLPNARLTPSALAKHWGALGDVKAPQTQQERDRETIAQRYAGGGIVVDMEGTT